MGVRELLWAWAITATGFTWVALVRFVYSHYRRRRRSHWAVEEGQTPVLCLRPADQPGPHERQAMAESVLGAAVRQKVVSSEMSRLSDPDCANRKVGHWVKALEQTPPLPGEVVVSLDADVRGTPELIHSLVGAVREGAAMAMAYPEPESGPLWFHHVMQGLLLGTHLSFRSQDVMRWGAPSACGKAMALGTAALAQLPALTQVVGEDLELAMRLHAQGHRVCWVEVPASVLQSPTLDFSELHARIVRWMQVLKAHRPGLYGTVPWLLAPCWPMAGLAWGVGTPGVVGMTVLLWLSRALLAGVLSPVRYRLKVIHWWVWGEALLLMAWSVALFRQTLLWRGHRFTLGRHGVLRKELSE